MHQLDREQTDIQSKGTMGIGKDTIENPTEICDKVNYFSSYSINVPVREVTLQFRLSSKWALAKQYHIAVSHWRLFLHNEFRDNSVFEAHIRSVPFFENAHIEKAHDTHSVSSAVELTLCVEHYIFTSYHCYHGKERKSSVYTTTTTAAISLHCPHISWLLWRPAEWACLHRASDMPEGTKWCAFLPHYGFQCCVRGSRLQHHWSVWFSSGACKSICTPNTRCHMGRIYLPQVFVEYEPRVRC